MGFIASPYNAGKLVGITLDIVHGDRWDPSNPFRWDSVLENYPGSPDYSPALPRCWKLRGNVIANAIKAYVDDVRNLGSDEINCAAAGRRASYIFQYLGQQDAARKYRPPHQIPGPWCGAFVASKDDAVWVYVSKEKWHKAKGIVQSLLDDIRAAENINAPILDHKKLEKGRGFMVYFARTYTSMTPFLKGFHLSLDSWRGNRLHSGWKQTTENAKVESYEDVSILLQSHEEVAEYDIDGDISAPSSEPTAAPKVNAVPTEPPTLVRAVPRFVDDLKVLASFLQPDDAPWRFVRGGRVLVVKYGFGDAAKSGFGASFESANGLWFRVGVWGSDEELNTSNFRELCNLVESLERLAASEGIAGFEIFLFTDNSTAEAAFYNGTSSSRKLFQLVVRLRRLEILHGCKLHFIHVAGTRMIAQGTDGVSRGDCSEGVMGGDTMLQHVPLHLTCLQRSPALQAWLERIAVPGRGERVEFLSSADWFQRGHDILGGAKNSDGIWIPHYQSGTYIWTPPPAGAWVAVEQLRMARVKREFSTHIFVVPHLMTPEWRRQLFRVSDLCIELPFFDEWKKEEQHEPLTIAFVFPFLSCKPWQLKRSPAFLGMGSMLRRMWKTDPAATGHLLHQLCSYTRTLAKMSESVVRQMLQSPPKFELLCSSGDQRATSYVEKEEE